MPTTTQPRAVRLLIDGHFHNIYTLYTNGHHYIAHRDFPLALSQPYSHFHALREADDPMVRSHHQVPYVNLLGVLGYLGHRINLVETTGTYIVETQPPTAATQVIFTAEAIPPHIAQQIYGSSFHSNPHFGMDHLAYLTITHVDFDGQRQHGHLIVAASIAQEVLDIFYDIYTAQFPIARVRLIDYYAAGDYYSMADNNSVAFNYRVIAGTNRLSRHAWGMAIDINPIQNPYLRGNTLWPAAGAPYLDRSNLRPGMIAPGCPVYVAFTSRGWIWGGHWTSPIDYHHFERR